MFISVGISQDSLQLVKLYNSTNGPKWINNSGWLSENSISEWHGIKLQDSFVISINLPRNNLSGQFPSEIRSLSNLESLNFADNNLYDDLPDSLYKLANLKNLNLSHNNFDGGLINLFNIKSLTTLDLSDNNFTGNIPKNIGKLINLEILNLSDNKFQNTIPIELFRLQNLTELNLRSNSLSGPIPRQIGNCNKLESLDLSRNKLTGIIPKEIGELKNLSIRLALDHNNLTGLIPIEISHLTDLQHLWLNNNKFSGILPFEIGNMTSIKSLFLYHNNFMGPLPLTLGNLRDLELLYAQNNSFAGKIPQEIWFLPKLKMLKLENNLFSGAIPGDLRILKSIQTINLKNNHIDFMSDSISLPASLISMDITNNNLFCQDSFAKDDSTAHVLSTEIAKKLIGIVQQNCDDPPQNTFAVGTDKIDFGYVKTDSTAEYTLSLSDNTLESTLLQLSHFNDNFFLSNTFVEVNQEDTVSISISYSPLEIGVHHDVIIISDTLNHFSNFISLGGEGVLSLLPERDTTIPWNFKLHPINKDAESDTLNIRYDVPSASKINISIYNLGGRPIKTIVDDIAQAGFHDYLWDGTDESKNQVEGGEYLCVMQSGMFIQIQHIMLFF